MYIWNQITERLVNLMLKNKNKYWKHSRVLDGNTAKNVILNYSI